MHTLRDESKDPDLKTQSWSDPEEYPNPRNTKSRNTKKQTCKIMRAVFGLIL